jgi:predicted phosphodiesterase
MRRVTWAVAILLLSLLSASMLGCGGSSDTIEEHPMRFAVIGDRTGTAQPGIYEQVLEEIQRLKPDFSVTVGDMIEGPAPDTVEINHRWKEYLGLIQTLTAPVYYTPGNNDIWDSTSLEFYRRYVGEPYRSFDIRGVHFVVLDNSRFFTIDEFPAEQIDWLTGDLRKSRNAAFTIVILHVPYWMNTIAEGKPDTLHSLFVQYGVDAVFTGHWHHYFSGEFDGILYTGMGSSGGATYYPVGSEYHFAWVTIDQHGISIAPVAMGAVWPWDEITAAQVQLINKMRAEAVSIDKLPVGRDLTVPRTEIGVTIKNLNDQVALDDTLSWEVPDGWTVTPRSVRAGVGPGNACTFKFSATSSGPVYPTPEFSLRYPYAEDKKFELTEALGISRTVNAHEAKEPPLIDGELTEAVWKDPTTRFFAPDGSAMFTDPVDFYFAWDKDNLYIAAKCMETKMDSIVANAKEHDGPIYGEDCVGYFLQPETADGPMYQIYLNPLGTAFDQKILVENGTYVTANRDWNGTYEVETSKGENYWSIEARIPLSQLDTENQLGKKWALNFRRKQKRLNTSADWLVPINYDPKDYGVLEMK